MATTVLYYLSRAAAIALGGACSFYSAKLSWEHYGNLMGPLAAVSAAALFIFAERAVTDRHWHHFLSMGVLGVLAAIISGSIVLQRNADTQAARLQAAQSSNLPRVEAQKALAMAEATAKAAEAAAGAECSSGRGRRCEALESREKAARQRVADARSKLVELGAHTAENPVAAVMGGWAGLFDRAMAVAPAIWLELAAPALLAYGFAPGRRKEPEPPKKKARRRRKKAAPRKPPAAPAEKRPQRAPLKLVAANDH